MDGASEFLAMGGYAAFVWPAYGLAAVVLTALFIASRRRLAAVAAELAAVEADERSTSGEA